MLALVIQLKWPAMKTPLIRRMTSLLPLASLLGFALALGLAAWQIPAADSPKRLEPARHAPSTALPAELQVDILPPAGRGASSPTLVELADGRLAAAWRSSVPGEEDESALWFSLRNRDGWQAPGMINHRAITAGSVFSRIGGVDRPQLYVEGSWLHLWYTASTFGQGTGLSIFHSVSTDAGQSWSKPEKLHSGPWASFGSQTSAPPVPLADGSLALPIQQSAFAVRGEWLQLDPRGRIVGKQRLNTMRPAAEPALIVLDGENLIALLRGADGDSILQASQSRDGGETWQPMSIAPLVLAATPLAALRLSSGAWLLAGNPPEGRGHLQLWLSDDHGAQWRASRRIAQADDGAADFTGPSLLQTRDGRIHLAFGWRGQQIKHLSFSEAWLRGEAP